MGKASESVELTIESVVYRGKGMARLDGCVVFVPGVCAGERVRAEILRRHKKYAEARLLEVIAPSPCRAAPVCPLAPRPAADPDAALLCCPGCVYQHMTYEEELRCKQSQLISQLEHTAKADAGLCLPPVAAPAELGYRNKIVLHVSAEPEAMTLGYVAEDNTTVVDVPACPLAAAPLNTLLAELRGNDAFLASLRPRQSLTLRHTPTDGALYWTGKPRRAERWLAETTTRGAILVPRGSFFQVNPPVADRLTEAVSAVLAPRPCEAVIDVYGGVGVFALAAARGGATHVLGIDHDAPAICAARRNAGRMGLRQIEFLCRPAGAVLAEALRAVDARTAVVIMDPPRRGLDDAVLAAIESTLPATLLYLSCAVDTLTRDIVRLKRAGYRLERARLFDMFPRTPYFETLAVLSRGVAR